MKKKSFVPVVPMSKSHRQLPADYSDVPEWLRPEKFRKKTKLVDPEPKPEAAKGDEPAAGAGDTGGKKSWIKRLLGAETKQAAEKVVAPKRKRTPKQTVQCSDVLGGRATGDEEFCKDMKKNAAPRRAVVNPGASDPSLSQLGNSRKTQQLFKRFYDIEQADWTAQDADPDGEPGKATEASAAAWDDVVNAYGGDEEAAEQDYRWWSNGPHIYETASVKAGTSTRTAGEPIVTKTIGGKKFNFQGDAPWIHPSKYGAQSGGMLSPEQAKKKQQLQQQVLTEISKLQKKEQEGAKQPGKLTTFLKSLITEPAPKTAAATTKEKTSMQTRNASTIRVATPMLRQIARTGQFVYQGYLYTADAEMTQGREPNRPAAEDAAPFIDDTYDSRKSENPPKMDDLDFLSEKKVKFKAPGDDAAAPFVDDTPAEYAGEKPHPVKASRHHRRRSLSAIR